MFWYKILKKKFLKILIKTKNDLKISTDPGISTDVEVSTDLKVSTGSENSTSYSHFSIQNTAAKNLR